MELNRIDYLLQQISKKVTTLSSKANSTLDDERKIKRIRKWVREALSDHNSRAGFLQAAPDVDANPYLQSGYFSALENTLQEALDNITAYLHETNVERVPLSGSTWSILRLEIARLTKHLNEANAEIESLSEKLTTTESHLEQYAIDNSMLRKALAGQQTSYLSAIDAVNESNRGKVEKAVAGKDEDILVLQKKLDEAINSPTTITEVLKFFRQTASFIGLPKEDFRLSLSYNQIFEQLNCRAEWSARDGTRLNIVRIFSCSIDSNIMKSMFELMASATREQIVVSNIRSTSSDIGKRKYPPHGVVYTVTKGWVPCTCTLGVQAYLCPACSAVQSLSDEDAETYRTVQAAALWTAESS